MDSDPLSGLTADDVETSVGSTDPLSQLADIRIPEEVGFWPPAPGWWLLFIIVLAAVIYALILARRHLQHYWRRRSALRELQACRQELQTGGIDALESRQNYVNAVNAVLRRVALQHHAQEHVASLNGERWLRFLREHGDASLLDDENALALSQGRFSPRCDVDPDKMQAMAERWINSLYLSRIRTEKPSAEAATDHA